MKLLFMEVFNPAPIKDNKVIFINKTEANLMNLLSIGYIT